MSAKSVDSCLVLTCRSTRALSCWHLARQAVRSAPVLHCTRSSAAVRERRPRRRRYSSTAGYQPRSAAKAVEDRHVIHGKAMGPSKWLRRAQIARVTTMPTTTESRERPPQTAPAATAFACCSCPPCRASRIWRIRVQDSDGEVMFRKLCAERRHGAWGRDRQCMELPPLR